VPDAARVHNLHGYFLITSAYDLNSPRAQEGIFVKKKREFARSELSSVTTGSTQDRPGSPINHCETAHRWPGTVLPIGVFCPYTPV